MNTKFVSRNTIKYIAMITMVIDHIGVAFLTKDTFLYFICRKILGRIAYPLFGFLFIEGMIKTKHPKKQLETVFLFACITEPVFDLFESGKLFDFSQQNILWLYLLIGIYILYQRKTETWKGQSQNNTILHFIISYLLIVLFSAISYWTNISYDIMGSIGLFLGYHAYMKTKSPFISTLCIAGIEAVGAPNIFCLIPAFIIIFYNKDKKCSHTKFQKYFGYSFYALQYGILFLVKVFVTKNI